MTSRCPRAVMTCQAHSTHLIESDIMFSFSYYKIPKIKRWIWLHLVILYIGIEERCERSATKQSQDTTNLLNKDITTIIFHDFNKSVHMGQLEPTAKHS